MRLCTCHSCNSETSLDPVRGVHVQGTFIGDAEYKAHQRQHNARLVGLSHPGGLTVNPPLFPQPSNRIDHSVDLRLRPSLPTRPTASALEKIAFDPNHTVDGDRRAFASKLNIIKSKLEAIDIPLLMRRTAVVFSSPPSRQSPPMLSPSLEQLELNADIPSNLPVVHQERWLQSAKELIQITLSHCQDSTIDMFAQSLGIRVNLELDLLERLKMQQWELLRKEMLSRPVRVRVVDTSEYVAKPMTSLSPVLLLCYLVVSLMHLIFGISLIQSKVLLLSLRKLLFLVGSRDQLGGFPMADAVPLTAQNLISRLHVDPKTTAYVCCQKCFCLYAFDADNPSTLPQRCSFRRTPSSVVCDTMLQAQKKGKKKKKKTTEPIRLVLYHELEDHIAGLYSRTVIEDHLDKDVLLEHDGDEMRDIHDAPELRNFLGPEGDPQRPFMRRPGNEARLVFSLNMDGFNPLMNKESGKKLSVGAMYMVCLTLPPSIRYDLENIFLICIIPGPHEPSKEEINHILSPLVDDLIIFWEHGFFLTSTSRYPHGRLARGAVVPLICDLPAARQMSGFAGYTSKNFCSFCKLIMDDIDNLDHQTWVPRNGHEHRTHAKEWRDAASEKERDELYEVTGVRWSELLRLPYWDPTKFVMIDSMHGFFLRMFQRHCRQIWGMNVEIEDGDYPSFAQDRKRPSDDVMKGAYHVLRYGSNTALSALKTPVLRELARSTDRVPYGGRAKRLIRELLKYRVQRGWFDDEGELLDILDEDNASESDPDVPMPPTEPIAKPRRTKKDPASGEEIEIGVKLLQTSTKKGLATLRKNVLIELCRLKDVKVKEKALVADLVEALESWRISNGLVDTDGKPLQPKKPTAHAKPSRDVGVLGKETLSQVRVDMDNLELPSWVSAAPSHPGEAKRGKFTADQWRTFCIINLPVTLNRLWGSEPEGSRRRRMLDNFMHLVTAVKLATMRCMTPERISLYVFHMSKYLKELVALYPGTTITAYQHLSLHFQDFLARFGPVHSWRCFPFERYNYLLQQIPTNMRIGELESTLLNRFCRGQKLRTLMKSEETSLPPELDDLLIDIEGVLLHDIRGSLRGDNLAFDESFQPLDEKSTWDTIAEGPLPLPWFRLLSDWMTRRGGYPSPPRISRLAFLRTAIKRLGEVYQIEDVSPRDSRVYFQDPQGNKLAGCIQGIFSHRYINSQTGKEVSQTFFVLRKYLNLPDDVAQHDPYRRFPEVAGRIFCDSFEDQDVIVDSKDLLYHFALGKVDLPNISLSCVLALPLDRA